MSVIFSKSGEYAMQAVLFLARHSASGPILLRDSSGSLSIPRPFLNKPLQVLVRDGIVESHRGSHGGFSLARPSNTIRLEEIIRSVEGRSLFAKCVLGFPSCRESNPCSLHMEWNQARSIILNILNKRTVAELSSGFEITRSVLES